jgi:hypothetical protein
MATKKAVGASIAVTLADDGSNVVSVTFTDTDGLPVTAAQLNNTWPSAVALPALTFADGTPGPSAFNPVAISPPTVSTADAGGFDVFSVTAVQPIVAGSGQGVDATLGIASGLGSSAFSTDAGTWTITSDPNALGGVAVVVT